jgi:DNA-binding SARP family transcriptional activator
VQGFESRRALALLCYLAAQDRPQSRAHLADLFWPDKPEARGRGNLSRVLHNLNALLPDCVTADRDAATFNAAICWRDTTAFVALTAPPAAPDALAEAAALYRDDLLAGLYLNDCPDFETWLVIERERWRQKIAAVCTPSSPTTPAGAKWKPGVRYADRLLGPRPLARRGAPPQNAAPGPRRAAQRRAQAVRTLPSDAGG